VNISNSFHKYAGVTLIEVLVAFVILSLSVTVLFRIFSTGTTNIIISQQYVDAIQVAESRITSLGSESELLPGIESGTSGDRYTWQTTIEPISFYEESDEEIYPVSAYRVTVQVGWVQRGQPREIQINTIKLQNNTITAHRG
jgi:general secretion pathway protein I